MSGRPINIVAVGVAVQDVFLSHSDEFKPVSDKLAHEQFLRLELGAKANVNNITFSTGGGATNAAVTFARQGLHAGFMGAVGHDPAGQAVLDALDKENVDTSHVIYNDRYHTGYSVLLLAPNGERIILTYRGASTHYDMKQFDLKTTRANWIYVSTLGGNMGLLHKLFAQASELGIGVMFNPGKAELKHVTKLKPLLEDIAVLLVNRDEAKQIVEGEDLEEIVRHLTHYVPTVVVTDGPNGVMATDSKTIVRAGMYEDVKVIDRTGAGDAFGSGFLAKWATDESLAESVIFASANSTSVVTQIGAKEGILGHNVKLHHMPIHEKPF